MSKRRTHSPEFKARVAMEAISARKRIQGGQFTSGDFVARLRAEETKISW